MADRELVLRGMAGDLVAYEQLARAIVRPLYLVAYRILRDGDAADDAVQQALLAIWQQLPRLRDPDRFDAWSYRLVVNAAIAETKRNRRQVRVQTLDVGLPGAPDHAPTIASRVALEQAFCGLSVDHRAVLVLRFYLGMSIAEIASTLDLPYGTVGSRIHYAIRSLRLEFGLGAGPAEVVPDAGGGPGLEDAKRIARESGR